MRSLQGSVGTEETSEGEKREEKSMPAHLRPVQGNGTEDTRHTTLSVVRGTILSVSLPTCFYVFVGPDNFRLLEPNCLGGGGGGEKERETWNR